MSAPGRSSTAALQVTRDIAADHPAFAGHFPGQPLLPGVLLLAEVFEAVRASAALSALLGPCPGIAAAKFLAPVRPGSRLTISLQPAGAPARQVTFELRCAEVPVASGKLVAEQGTAPGP